MLGSMICAAEVERPAKIGSTEPIMKLEPKPALTPQKAAAKPAVKDKHLLSYWKKPNGELLVVLSNLTNRKYTGKIEFKNAVPGKVLIQDENGETAFDGKCLNVSVPAKDFKLYRIIPVKR